MQNVVRRNKGVGGKGKLSLAIIDKLQNYYGIAIRSNIANLAAMKKGILASLFHVASSAKMCGMTIVPRVLIVDAVFNGT